MLGQGLISAVDVSYLADTVIALRYFEAARDLMGTDYYDHPWLRSVPAFVIGSTLPDFDAEECVMTYGDAGRSYASHGPTHILYRLAAEYQNPHAQWLAREMDRRSVGRGDYCTWANLLWYDPRVPMEPISSLPTLTSGVMPGAMNLTALSIKFVRHWPR